jgi:hypothetical protein
MASKATLPVLDCQQLISMDSDRSIVQNGGSPEMFTLNYIKKVKLTLNEAATTGRIIDRVEVKLDLTSDQ